MSNVTLTIIIIIFLSITFPQRDFQTFADITMMDSNQFHATCLDTFPPIFYMNDVSRAVVATVHALNKASGRNVCAYTFDAGPNAVSTMLYVYADRFCARTRAHHVDALSFVPIFTPAFAFLIRSCFVCEQTCRP